jgi:hypothetical protein
MYPMRVNIWDIDTRECVKKEHITADIMTGCKKSRMYDIYYEIFCRAYSVSSDWPMPHTRVDTYVQHIDLSTYDASFFQHFSMRQYMPSRGMNGTLLTRPNSTHIVRTVMRMAGVGFREKITHILLECIQIYGDKLPLVVLECPQTWLFVESAHGLIAQCADGRFPASGDLVNLASLLPSKSEWCKLRDEMQFKIGSMEANTHLWCWFRLRHVFTDYIDYTNTWKSGVICTQNILGRTRSV